MPNIRQWLRDREQEHPGFAARLWEQFGRDATAAGDARVAEYLRVFAATRQETIPINGSQWADYRIEMGLVSFHRRRRLIDPSQNGQGRPEAPGVSDEELSHACAGTIWTPGVGYPETFLAVIDTRYGDHDFLPECLEPVLIDHIHKNHRQLWPSLHGVINTYHELWRYVHTWHIIGQHGDMSDWDLCKVFYQLYVKDIAAYGDTAPHPAHFARWAVWYDISVVVEELFGSLLTIALDNLSEDLFREHVDAEKPVQTATSTAEMST